MAKGRKTGGRKKGTRNKRLNTVQARLRKFQFDPVAALIMIADDPLAAPSTRMRVCEFLYLNRLAEIEALGAKLDEILVSAFPQ
jgi:hypothetical protein